MKRQNVCKGDSDIVCMLQTMAATAAQPSMYVCGGPPAYINVEFLTDMEKATIEAVQKRKEVTLTRRKVIGYIWW